MIPIVDGPLPGAQTSLRGNNSPQSGPYLNLGTTVGPVILDRQHMLDVYQTIGEKFGGGAVTMDEHVGVSRQLKEAHDRFAQLEGQERTHVAKIEELERKLASKQDDLNSANATNKILELRLTELKTDPATIARQALLEQVRATTHTNGTTTPTAAAAAALPDGKETA